MASSTVIFLSMAALISLLSESSAQYTDHVGDVDILIGYVDRRCTVLNFYNGPQYLGEYKLCLSPACMYEMFGKTLCHIILLSLL